MSSKQVKNKITIAVATHKVANFPEDLGYIPLHVGSALSKPLNESYVKDDVGDGVSELNPYFCELTALNWLVKKSESEFLGLAHYRRYFKSPRCGVRMGKYIVASSDELLELMKSYDIILPKPRNYVIEDVRTHYNNAHYEDDLLNTEDVIKEIYPEYVRSLEKVLSKKTVSLYNMFVLSSEKARAYSQWLFKILFEVEKRSSYKEYDAFQARVFGRLSEILLNVWVDHNIERTRICYLPVVNIEGENLLKKAYYLLRRKFLNEKLSKSF